MTSRDAPSASQPTKPDGEGDSPSGRDPSDGDSAPGPAAPGGDEAPPDTSDFEAAGLLEGLEDDAREARLDLLRQLADAGVPLEELEAAVEEDRLTLLPVERVLAGDARYTLEEVAERSGLDLEALGRLQQALGLPRPESDEPRFADADVEAARVTKQFLDAGLPEDGLLEVGRVLGEGLSRVAEAMRALVGDTFLEPGDTERDAGLRYAEAAKRLVPLTGPLLEYVLNLHMREGVKSDVVSRADIRSGHVAGAREVAVAFADLVGFTRLGERVPADELGGVAGKLSELASDLAAPPIRLVKTIGDAAMLVSSDPDALVDATLELVAAAEEAGEDFPQLHAGVALGQALNRGGDWYGQPVNLASRVTSIARPGSVLATPEVREAAGEGYRWSAAGKRRIKGVKGSVELFRVRRQDGDASG